MWVANKRPRTRNYAVDKKGAKSGIKVLKAVKHFEKLLKRVKIEWETTWIVNAKHFALAKLKKYGINPNSL